MKALKGIAVAVSVCLAVYLMQMRTQGVPRQPDKTTHGTTSQPTGRQARPVKILDESALPRHGHAGQQR